MSEQYGRCWGCWMPLYGGAVFCRKCRKRERRDLWALWFVMAAIWTWVLFFA